MSAGGSSASITAAPLITRIPEGVSLVRIHRAGDGPVWFGPVDPAMPTYRFDAPNGEYRTIYLAERLNGAFVETVLRGAKRIVSRAFVEQREWCELRLLRDVQVLQLHGPGLHWHGQTADISTGSNYARSQEFAARMYAEHPAIDGIAYRSRHDNEEICYALFDRVDPAHLEVADRHKFAAERAITDELMRRYNAAWDPMTPLPPLR